MWCEQPKRYDRQDMEQQLAETRRTIAHEEAQLEELQVYIQQLRYKEAFITKYLAHEFGSDLYRTPTEMLRPEFKGMRLGDIIQGVLSNAQEPLTSKEIANRVYFTHSPDEFDRARGSVSAELRSSAKGANPKWKKIGRSGYVALPEQMGGKR